VKDKLQALAELQKVDLEIAALRKSTEAWPREMRELERELVAARAAVEAERARAADLERQRKELEQNITAERDKVKKWEQRLTEQRSTREYSALAREIDIARKANATMHDEVAALNRSLNEVRELVKGKEQEFQVHQARIGAQMQELRERMNASEGHVAELNKRRSAVAHNVDATLIRRYDAVRKKRMPAMVSVAGGRCTGCNMNIPPQLYNTLCATLGTDVCPSCHRIIHAAEALEQKPAS
jgi:uncharacterized protein